MLTTFNLNILISATLILIKKIYMLISGKIFFERHFSFGEDVGRKQTAPKGFYFVVEEVREFYGSKGQVHYNYYQWRMYRKYF